MPEVPENPNYEQYGPSAVQYEGGDNAFSTDANTGYTVYTALATSWDSRRGKLLDSYTAGQYVAIEVYSDYALMHTHMYFYGATLKGVYDKETKQIVDASAMQKGKWYILVWEINADIANVGGYSGTFMFLDLNQDGTLAGKTVLINNAYVFDDKTAFDSWVTA